MALTWDGLGEEGGEGLEYMAECDRCLIDAAELGKRFGFEATVCLDERCSHYFGK